ncbi:MAG: hypothetical protein KGH75_07500 [Rhodospirillales bacterium]|nr:hypothetical protein [Rhodospirillales bacterium]
MTNEEIIREARERFKRAQDWEANARQSFLDDMRFAEGDSYNNWQWPDAVVSDRQLSRSPILTINKTRQHCLQIINDARQNKVEVRYAPSTGGATQQAADVLNGIARAIAYASNADEAMMAAVCTQVKGGWGYWRLITDYVSDDSFDQEIRWVRVADPLTVYLDPDIQEQDGSDARYGFVYVDRAKDDVEAEFPRLKGKLGGENAIAGSSGWITVDKVRDCEYFRRRQKRDKLIMTAKGETFRRSVVGAEIADALLQEDGARERDVMNEDVEWFRIIGDEIVEKSIWPGKYVPLFRVIGEETVIEGRLDRKGHTRALLDPQRMYNYYSSMATELFALQPRAPFVAPIEAIRNHPYWNSANIRNYSVLPYNGFDEQGRPIAPPQRAEPPPISQGVMAGLQSTAMEMQMVSGQYQALMGEESHEKSGKAINARQRQGENSTYHYIDHLAGAVRFTGKAILDLIPKVYDTKRAIKIMGLDGSEETILIDPRAKQAYQEHEQELMEGVKKVFNPTVGTYSVRADVGPAYATARQQTFDALIQLAGMSPEFMAAAGDLIVKSADFEMADELAERLYNMVPPQALGGPPPQLAEAQQEIQKLQGALSEAMQKLATARGKQQSTEQQKAIDTYKAETDRLQALKDIDPAILVPIIRQVAAQALANPLQPIDELMHDMLQSAPAPPMPMQQQPQGGAAPVQ